MADEPAHTASTDDRGRASFKLSTREFAESQVLKVTAKLPQWNVAAEVNAYLALRGFSIDVRTVRNKFVAGETFAVTVSTKDPEGRPVGQQLKLKVFELVTENGQVSERPQGEHDLQTAAADGTGRTTLKLDKGGRYRLRAEGADRRNNPCSGQTTVFVSDERDRTRLLVLADRQDYRAGETAEVNLYWREKPALALVTFEGSRVFGYRLVPLQTGANKLPVPMGADLAPNFELAVAVMTEAARFHQASCPFTVERELRVSLDVRRPGGAAGPPAPGEPVEVTVTTSDPQGKPVAAEVSLALVERALLEEFPGAMPDIRAMFRGQPRTPAVRTGSSVSFAYRPPTRFAGTTVMAEAERPQETAPRMPWPAGMGGGGFFGGSTPAESQPSPAVRAAASFEQLVQWMEQAGKPSDDEVDEAAETDAEAAAGGAEETSGQPGGSVGRPATTSGPATTPKQAVPRGQSQRNRRRVIGIRRS